MREVTLTRAIVKIAEQLEQIAENQEKIIDILEEIKDDRSHTYSRGVDF